MTFEDKIEEAEDIEAAQQRYEDVRRRFKNDAELVEFDLMHASCGEDGLRCYDLDCPAK